MYVKLEGGESMWESKDKSLIIHKSEGSGRLNVFLVSSKKLEEFLDSMPSKKKEIISTSFLMLRSRWDALQNLQMIMSQWLYQQLDLKATTLTKKESRKGTYY